MMKALRQSEDEVAHNAEDDTSALLADMYQTDATDGD
jgi:hypothetical protein